MPNLNLVFPPFPTFPPPQTNAVSTGTVSGTSGTYIGSSSNGQGPGCLNWSNKSSYISSVAASVTGPLDGTANYATMATYAVDVPPLTNYTSKQALALAIGAPKTADINFALANNTALNSVFTGPKSTFSSDCYKFIIGELGGRYNIGGRRLETVNTQIAMNLNMPAGQATGDVYVGLYNFQDGAFNSAQLKVSVGGDVRTSPTFTSYAAFKAYFQNNALKFEHVNFTPPLQMKVIFSQNLSSGQGVYFDVMIADPQPESTQASTLTKFMGADPQPSVLSIVDLGPGDRKSVV